jgi:hypothetical protein
MKRYMWTNFFIGTIRNFVLSPDLPQAVKEQELDSLRRMLAAKHGTDDIEGKLERYLNFKPPDLVVVTEFHPMVLEVEDAYICGHYYPSLTGACCIGERILNVLVLRLRDYHKKSEWYKRIYGKESFDDWGQAIQILSDWNVLSRTLATTFTELKDIRHQSVHFRRLPDLENRAIDALNCVLKITNELFGMRDDVLFIQGHLFVKKQMEADPVVKEFYLPAAHYVGHRYRVENDKGTAVVIDEHEYENREITDEEFIELVKSANK